MNVLVMSIKPQYAEAIYSGTKQFEFRKKPPSCHKVSFATLLQQSWRTLVECAEYGLEDLPPAP